MNLEEELFELIRAEEILLWAGAGLSLYAGYPSAKELCKKFISALPEDKSQLITSQDQLDIVTDEFLKICSNKRSALDKVIEQIFTVEPSSIEYHEKLARIPHFNTIITTNYDLLFEKSYNDKIIPIVESSHLKSIVKGKISLFKIHGDVNHKDNIIITKNDYSEFYSDLIDNVYWTTVKSKIINSNILFIGYNAGDININTILNSIQKELGNNSKKHFLVAPNFPQHEIDFLKSKNIFYIDSTGEKLIDRLIEHLRSNVISDFKSGIISQDTLNKFLSLYGLAVDYLAAKDIHQIGAVKSLNDEPTLGVLSMRITEETNKELNEYIKGQKFGQFEIENQNANFNFDIAGIKFLDSSELRKIVIVSQPSIKTTFSIVFENGFEVADLPVMIFKSRYKTQISTNYNGKQLEVTFSKKSSFNISLTFGSVFGKVRDELATFKFLEHFLGGVPFTIFEKTGHKFKLPGGESNDRQMYDHVKKYVHFFDLLYKIERAYDLRFNSIPEITDDTYEIVKLLFYAISEEETHFDFTTSIDVPLHNGVDVQELAKGNYTGGNVIMSLDNFEVSIYGHTVVFKEKKIVIYDAYVSNMKEIENGNSNVLKLKSKVNIMSTQYIK